MTNYEQLSNGMNVIKQMKMRAVLLPKKLRFMMLTHTSKLI
jgi:hypothetical protein